MRFVTRVFISLVALAPVAAFMTMSCQEAKTALDIADKVCRVVDVLDPAGTGKTIEQVVDVADRACDYVRIVYLDPETGAKRVEMVPKAALVRGALEAKPRPKLDGGV